MSEHNTQLPTSGMLSGKPRWEVRRRSRNGKGHEWRVYRPDGKRDGRFRTWRKAMQHVDRQTSTLVRVPELRLDNTGSVYFPSGNGITMNDHLGMSVLYGDCIAVSGDAVFTSEAVIPRHDWKPLGQALLALHYQEVRE